MVAAAATATAAETSTAVAAAQAAQAAQALSGTSEVGSTQPTGTQPFNWHHLSPTADYDLSTAANQLKAAASRLDEMRTKQKQLQLQLQLEQIQGPSAGVISSQAATVVRPVTTAVSAHACAPVATAQAVTTGGVASSPAACSMANADEGGRQGQGEGGGVKTLPADSSCIAPPTLTAPPVRPPDVATLEFQQQQQEQMKQGSPKRAVDCPIAETEPKNGRVEFSLAPPANGAVANKRQRLVDSEQGMGASSASGSTASSSLNDHPAEGSAPSSRVSLPSPAAGAVTAAAATIAGGVIDKKDGLDPAIAERNIAGVSSEARGDGVEGQGAGTGTGGAEECTLASAAATSSLPPSGAAGEQPRSTAGGVHTGDILLHPHAIKA